MKVILLKDTKKVGRKYDIKDVADGFAINSLIPGGFAVAATPNNIKTYEAKRKADMSDIARTEAELEKAISDIKGIVVEIKGKINDKGHLFAGVHKEQISEEIKKQKGVEIQSEYILLDKPLKEVGDHTISVKVGNREAQFKLVIKGE
ncbi:MAG: 50S ribosomal protein L9 [bacterium]